MAKIHEEVIVIKLTKLVKNTENSAQVASEEILTAVEQVVQELVGQNIIVEVEKA